MKTEKLILLISEVLNLPSSEITLDSKRNDIDRWDSLAHIQIVAAIEEEFKTNIPFEDIADIKKVNEFMKYIQ